MADRPPLASTPRPALIVLLASMALIAFAANSLLCRAALVQLLVRDIGVLSLKCLSLCLPAPAICGVAEILR